MIKHILSLGCGVNSTALLIYLVEKKLPLDEVIFADTGTEKPETYSFLPNIERFCKKKKVKLTIVKAMIAIKRDLPSKVFVSDLKEYCYLQRIIPFRKFRSCTDKFKVRPIHKYLKKNYSGCKIIMYIGFDYGEKKRVKPNRVTWIEKSYPLIDAQITRKGCIEIIKHAGLPVPVKSGCYFCPFQTLKQWKKLREEHIDLFNAAMVLEERAQSRNPKALYSTIPLRQLDKAIREQRSLSGFIDSCYDGGMKRKQICDTAWCFT